MSPAKLSLLVLTLALGARAQTTTIDLSDAARFRGTLAWQRMATGTPALGNCPIVTAITPAVVIGWGACGSGGVGPAGPAGPQGATGPTGPTGATGPAGTGLVLAGVSDVIGLTASQGSVTLVSAPATGKYRISYYMNENALCSSGSLTVMLRFSWFDPVANRAVQSLGLTVGVTQSAVAGSIQGIVPIFAQASTAITYSSTVTESCISGSASYDVHVAVEAL